ncbi:MAG: Dabb family protein [Actinobacteria bacterium]|nr:Dabb family protein [Actinomycetota bacterium]
MFLHVVRFSYKPGTSEEDKAMVVAGLSGLARAEEVAFVVVGPDLGDPADGFEGSSCVAFEDTSVLESYILHQPIHRETDLSILPHLQRLAAVDVSDDGEEGVRDRIHKLHQERMANDPELADLFSSIQREP